jgi:di/tricarboxylate transporter
VTQQIVTTLSIISMVMVPFVWNQVRAAVVAVAGSLALYFTGTLTMQGTLGGFRDPVVVLIAALLAIATGLETAGSAPVRGQLLIHHTGTNETRGLVATMIVAAVFSGLIGSRGHAAHHRCGRRQDQRRAITVATSQADEGGVGHQVHIPSAISGS